MRRLAIVASVLVACGSAEEEPPPRPEPPRPATAVTPREPDGEAVEHTLRFPAPHTHYVEVQSVFPHPEPGAAELFMPVWTPGSYLVREYSRHVEDVRAARLDGEPLEVAQTAKNRWRVQAGDAPRFVLRYRVYCRDLTVRTNFVDADVAILNGAPTFLSPVGGERRPQDVVIEPAEGWEQSLTALPARGDAPHRYLARDLDELIDSPIVIGNPTVHTLEVAGTDVRHRLVNVGEGTAWDGARSARDVADVVEAQIAFWGEVPYPRYDFLNVLIDDGGSGLEHHTSTLLTADRFATRRREDYLDWLGLVSHELFHAWNVKRLRPVELGPFDYERENHTRSLWVSEGLTSYYQHLLLHRAGLTERDELLKKLGEAIERVQSTPGRAVQSLEQASYDAWIRFYRWDENTRNSTIDYYRKGAVVGFLLDARIRAASGGLKSLDDAMRLAYSRHADVRGFTPQEFQQACEQVAGASLEGFFASAVRGTDELDYEPALEFFGLRFEPPEDDDEPAGFLGVTTREVNGRLGVTQILRDTPAHAAGLQVDDELLAIDDYRLPPGGLDERLARYRPDDRVTLLVARRGEIRRLRVSLGRAPEQTWRLQVRDDASPVQRSHLEAWLGRSP